LNSIVGGLFEENTAKIVATQAEERTLEQAQRDIYESHRHRIFSLAFYMTGNEIEAERLLTSSFIKAFETCSQPDGSVIDQSLLAELRTHLPLTPVTPASVAVSGTAPANFRRTDLEEAIRQLPAFERLAFLLRDVEGYAPDAIADLLGSTTPEVQRTLFSARIRLRGILAELSAKRAA
jgi:RNA polymerase sigma-70 factor, ECF subfamily